MTNAVQDRAFPQDDGLSKLKEFMEIPQDDTSDDMILNMALESAKEDADDYLNNPFEDSDGNDEKVPTKVELGVIVWASVVAYREAPELKSEGIETDQKSYRSPEKAKEQIQKKYWSSKRKIPK